MLVNAAVTATFSSVHDRYQSRVVWLIPMLASLVLTRWLTPAAIPECRIPVSQDGETTSALAAKTEI
jgi:hypothetical protein